MHFSLRCNAASLLGLIARAYSHSSHTLRPRLARTCLKHFLDPTKPLGTNYGGIKGLQAVGGPEVVRALIVPNLKAFEVLIRDGGPEEEPTKKAEKEEVLSALVAAVAVLEAETLGVEHGMLNGEGEGLAGMLREKVGELVAERVLEMGRPRLVKAILEC